MFDDRQLTEWSQLKTPVPHQEWKKDWEKTGDPWLDTYLDFVYDCETGKFDSLTNVPDPVALDVMTDYALELRRRLPAGSPSTLAAMVITRDISARFPELASQELLAGLWAPR